MASFDGRGLFHAYGPATDTQQLVDLFGDENARESASHYLYSAILHQGTPWTATAPVVTLLMECLALDGAACARQDVLEFCTDVAEAVTGTDPASTPESVRAEVEARRADLNPEAIATWAQIAATGDEDAYQEAFEDDQVGEAMFSGVLLAILDAMPGWAAAALAWVGDPDPAVALAATRCVVVCDPRRRSDLTPVLREWTYADRPEEQRAYAVHLLGQIGAQVRPFLTDPSRAVRFLAALAPGQAEDDDADRVLIEALRDPATFDAAFEDGPSLLDWRPSIAAIARGLGVGPLPSLNPARGQARPAARTAAPPVPGGLGGAGPGRRTDLESAL